MIYHRKSSPTQTRHDAKLQLSSREIWGQSPRDSDIPKVQAYVGPLPDGEEGIEFITKIPPDRGCPPGSVSWTGGQGEVRLEEGFAKISVTIT